MKNRLRTATYWTDKHGIDHDITAMSDQYIVNIMGYLTRRKGDLDDIEWEAKQIETEINFIDSWNMVFADELQRRSNEGISIDREDGCEFGL